MGNPLLDRASPRELAERGQVIEKEEKLELFPRLTEAVAADLQTLSAERRPRKWRQAPVAIRLAFGWADDRARWTGLTGSVAARLPAVCQRCLEPLTLSLEQAFRFLLVGPDAPAMPLEGDEAFEAWEIDGPVVRPADIVEEVLIMAMPLAAMHADSADCGPLAGRLTDAAGDTVQPFADLRARMRQED